MTRFKPVELNVDADESLLLTVDATLAKVGPDPLPDVAETEPLDDAASNAENDAASSDAAASAESAVKPETSEA